MASNYTEVVIRVIANNGAHSISIELVFGNTVVGKSTQIDLRELDDPASAKNLRRILRDFTWQHADSRACEMARKLMQ